MGYNVPKYTGYKAPYAIEQVVTNLEFCRFEGKKRLNTNTVDDMYIVTEKGRWVYIKTEYKN